MHKALKLCLTWLQMVALCSSGTDAHAEAGAEENSSTLPEAIRHGDTQLRLRLRHEHLDAENFASRAEATTLLTRVDYHTRPWNTLQLFLQLDDVRHIGAEDFNDTRNGRTAYPVVPDPDGFTLNGLHLDWTGIPSTVLRVGRQCLDYDYVGCTGLAWRQNDPVFDALSIVNKSLPDVAITAAYITAMQTPFGPHEGIPLETLHMHSATVIAEYTGWPGNRLGLHAYRFDSKDLPSSSADSLGLRLGGSRNSGAWQWLYGARYFTQTDTGPNANAYRAAHYFLESGISRSGWAGKLSWDVLEGDAMLAGRNYTRPFNVVHFHLGWAEKFAVIPATGVKDLFFTLSGALGPHTRSVVIYHDFRSEATSRHFGTEWDGQLAHDFSPHVQGLLKLADYRAADTGPGPAGLDARTVWVQALLTY